MTKRYEVYRCEVCGNMVEVLRDGAGELVCCSRPMTRLTENTTDASKEKHVPVIERTPQGVKVSVGSAPHPMEEKHYIEWIELQADGRVMREYLKPGMAPTVLFTGVTAQSLVAREHCNLHGLWKA